jgi:hypothetical protein
MHTTSTTKLDVMCWFQGCTDEYHGSLDKEEMCVMCDVATLHRRQKVPPKHLHSGKTA